jgi:hypothetical protein
MIELTFKDLKLPDDNIITEIELLNQKRVETSSHLSKSRNIHLFPTEADIGIYNEYYTLLNEKFDILRTEITNAFKNIGFEITAMGVEYRIDDLVKISINYVVNDNIRFVLIDIQSGRWIMSIEPFHITQLEDIKTYYKFIWEMFIYERNKLNKKI